MDQGSYGVIYKLHGAHAYDSNNTNNQYILKKFKLKNNIIPYAIINEISFNELFKHTNISKIHDLCEIDNQINIIFPYYGLSIFELNKNFYFNINNIKIFLKQILEGVNYLHKNGIVHRDLSSKNILIDSNNKLTIIDFGFSKINNINKIYNHNIYTIPYRAPEIILNNEYDYKIDIWAVGCILGEMLLNNLLLYMLEENDEEIINTIFKFIGTPTNIINNNNKIINIKNYPVSIQYFIDCFGDRNLSDLFIKLLEFDPKKRIDAETALNHPYFI